MATGLINGTDLLIKIGSSTSNEVIVAYATSCTLDISADEIDQTSKDAGGWKSIISGLRSWSATCDALYKNEVQASTNTFQDFWGNINTRTAVQIELTIASASGGDGNVYYSGEAFVTSLSVSGGTEDQSTYSISLAGSGALSQTAAA